MPQLAGLIISLALHLGLLACLVAHPLKVQLPPPEPPHTGVSMVVAPLPKLSGGEGRGLACGGTRYNGIGLAASFGGFVTRIGPDTPAERAGFQYGDEIQNPDDLWPNTRPTNTEIDVPVKRAGKRLVLHARIESICQEK
jgi:hypothetical protein